MDMKISNACSIELLNNCCHRKFLSPSLLENLSYVLGGLYMK